VRENFKALKETLADKAGVEVLPVEGGWYAIVRAQLAEPEDEWALRLLNEAHTYVHPGFFFDFEDEGNIVLSLLPPAEKFREGVCRMRDAF
jgi:hypothetical protein